ncbi:chemotaxis protein CheB [Hymenobacter sp.]|jgi:hypothetical protein|uniref:chemotaxis protein CheB n=1 Tax=Hymenobacter sp. TaxID=1898978 RepID=UPI002EDAF1FE
MAVPTPGVVHKPHRDIVVIGASAGGVSALLDLVKTLPHDFPAPIFVVQHVAADSQSILPELLRPWLKVWHRCYLMQPFACQSRWLLTCKSHYRSMVSLNCCGRSRYTAKRQPVR